MTLYDFPVSDEMKALGFSRVYKKDKNLVVYNSPALITSRYFKGDLASTLHHLEKALIDYDKRNNHFGNEKLQRFVRWFAELDIKTDEAEEDAAKEIKRIENIQKERIIEEIKESKAAHTGISSEDWRIGLVKRFETLHEVVDNNLPELWAGLEFELCCMRILNIHGCTLPIIAIILGRAAGGKTQVISLLRKWPYAYYTDSHSAKSWVTHTASVEKEEDLEKIDMLPRVKNRVFCTPEWAPIFTLREDDLRAALGIITRIADGQGLASNSGVYGRRAYEGIHMFAWIGAAVDVPHLVYKVLGTLGQKLYFFRLPFKEITIHDIEKDLGSDFNTKFDAIQTALFDYLKWFEIGPDLKYDDRDGEVVDEITTEKDLRYKPGVPGNQFKFHDDDDLVWNGRMRRKLSESETKIKGARLLKIEWNRDKDDSQVKRCISELAKLLSHLRCDVRTWREGADIGYAPSLPEHPKRAAEILFNLAKAHALLYGRNFVTTEDLPIIVKTVLSTAEIERVKVFSLLLANNSSEGWLSTSQITQSLNISPQTARRKMTEFKAIGLVDEEYTGSNHELSMKLADKFNWFLSEEFNHIRDGFEPADYRKYLKEDITSEVADQHSLSLSYASAYEKMIVFDRVFNELASEFEPSAMEDDKGTVGRYELQKRLVLTGMFDQVSALMIIDEMIRIKKIKIVMVNTYRSNSKEDVPQ